MKALDETNNITVIIPSYNRSKLLTRALQSLAAQTDSDFEVIVCDDGSTENIARVVELFKNALKISLLQIKNSGGPAKPRNIATRAATTRWVSYLDSDDWWHPGRIKAVRKELNSDRDIVYHFLEVVHANNTRDERRTYGKRLGEKLRCRDATSHMLLFGNPIPTSAVTIRRELMLAIGGFDENPKLASVEDFDAWLRLSTNGTKFHCLSEILGNYWVGSDQISKFSKKQFECQQYLFESQINYLPARYSRIAKGRFAYLLGSYALDLGLPNYSSYYRSLSFFQEPDIWLKAAAKQLLLRIARMV
jgi:glycosyltransferase involved in cell wall biosynthesis